jgi:hypothetical protein
MSTCTPFAVKLVRRGIANDELLADVRSVAAQLQTDRLSTLRYDQLGRFSAATIMRRFGSWKKALRRLGLRPAHDFNTGKTTLLRDLRRVARLLKADTVQLTAYRLHGRFRTDAMRKKFGSWHRALLAAGLVPKHYRALTDAELFDNLKKVWEQLNRQPRVADMRPPVSLYTVGPYHTRFGTWCKALAAFQSFMHPELAKQPIPPRPRKMVNTHINLRLRYQILQRDHFRCQACGRSPANDPMVQLQIDHKHPRSQGGSSAEDNLQVLCERCNEGKGDMADGPL